jgi:hypothetical protein
MLHRFFVLTFLLSTYASCIQATTFPKYQEIVETLIRTTETCRIEFQPHTKLSLEKRADGYWVGVATWDFTTLRYDISQKQLFWPSKEQKYTSVQFNVNDAKNTTISKNNLVSPYKSISEQDPYNVHPFFGYKGWYHDVIKWYTTIEKEQTLKDFQLYSLARAYSDYARILLSDQGAVYFAIPSEFLTTDKADSKRIDLFNRIENKAVHYFYQTYLKNPNWNTTVGSIFTKYSNEIVTQYHTLALHTKHKEALKVFKGKDLYTKETLAFVANMLRSCPLNAILWTYGDNTSLPMFYLQQIQGIRTDVTVMDAYQLSLWRYIDYVKNPKIHSNPILLELDPAIYHKDNNPYIFIKKKQAHLSIKDLEIALTTEQENKIFNTKNIYLPFNKNEQLKLDLKNEYLIKSEWISLFILANNQRPFCFLYDFKVGGLAFTKNLGLQKYLYPVGWVYQLDKEEHGVFSDEEIETRYQVITKDLKWPSIKEIKEENRSPFHQYLWSIIVLANDLHNSGKSAQTVYLLDDFRKIFPLNSTFTSFNSLFYFIDLYFKTSVPSKAELLVTECFEELLSKEDLTKDEFNFVQRVDTILQERKIDKFNKPIQQLYLKFQ